MVSVRARPRRAPARPGRKLDGVWTPELRAWLLELRETLSPESIAGFVRGLKAFGNWCAAEELGEAAGFRALRRPRVPRRLIAPFTDAELSRLLAAMARRRATSVLSTVARYAKSEAWCRHPLAEARSESIGPGIFHTS